MGQDACQRSQASEFFSARNHSVGRKNGDTQNLLTLAGSTWPIGRRSSEGGKSRGTLCDSTGRKRTP